MYKCLDIHTGDEIVILSPIWRERIHELRELDKQGRLICQGCSQPVRVRAGRFRRRHFAHKHLQNCPYLRISSAVINARGKVYDWLSHQFSAGEIDLEVNISGDGLPRPIDACVYKDGKRISFWIVDVRLQPKIRKLILNSGIHQSQPINFLFLSRIMENHSLHTNQLILSTTEREFARTTVFDNLYQSINRTTGQSLFYLNIEQNELNCIRDLHCVHDPQVYRGVSLLHPINEWLINVNSGEIYHHNEAVKLSDWNKKRQHIKKKIRNARGSMSRIMDKIYPEPNRSETDRSGRNAEWEIYPPETKSQTVENLFRDLAECFYCGRETDDWWFIDRNSGKCKCRNCLKLGKF